MESANTIGPTQLPSKEFSATVEIQGLPKTLNFLNHKNFWVKTAEKEKWRKLVRVAFAGLIPTAPLKRATLKLTRFSSSEPDYDGLVSSFKHVIDALIKIGVLENDKISNIGQPIYAWKKVAPKMGKIEIEVTGVRNMKISELIDALQKHQVRDGDIDVKFTDQGPAATGTQVSTLSSIKVSEGALLIQINRTTWPE